MVMWFRSRGRTEVKSTRALVTHSDSGALGSSIVVLLVALAALTVTLVANNPNSDDSAYVDFAVSALDHPDRPLLRFDGMHGEPDLPLFRTYYRLHSYELLTALFASYSGLEPLAFYHLMFPGLFALLFVASHWLALRFFFGENTAAAGLVIVFLALLVWGGSGHAFGNFGFVRLFQGKAALVMFAVPALFYYSMRTSKRATVSRLLLLAAAVASAVGLSVTGAVVAPVLLAIVALSGWRPERLATRRALLTFAPALYVVVPAFVAILTGEVLSGVLAGFRGQSARLEDVLATDTAGVLALVGLLAAALTFPSRLLPARLARFAALATVLLINPWVATWMSSTIAFSLSWRTFWIIPFPLFVGVLACWTLEKADHRGLRTALGLGFVVVLLAGPGAPVLASENGTQLGLPGYKINHRYPTVKRVLGAGRAGAAGAGAEQCRQSTPALPRPPSTRLRSAPLSDDLGPRGQGSRRAAAGGAPAPRLRTTIGREGSGCADRVRGYGDQRCRHPSEGSWRRVPRQASEGSGLRVLRVGRSSVVALGALLGTRAPALSLGLRHSASTNGREGQQGRGGVEGDVSEVVDAIGKQRLKPLVEPAEPRGDQERGQRRVLQERTRVRSMGPALTERRVHHRRQQGVLQEVQALAEVLHTEDEGKKQCAEHDEREQLPPA